jgi:glycerate 2-kinase
MTLPSDALEIWNAGVAAVRADALVNDQFCLEDGWLFIDDEAIDMSPFDRVLMVGAGKAAAAMATAIHRALSMQYLVRGWINVPEGTCDDASKLGDVHVCFARPAGVNEPTQAAVEGTRQILNLVQTASDRDLCLVVLTGGGSALLCAPADGISLDDKLTVIRHLSGSGADIEALNTVRKQLSQVKGGGLRRASHAGGMVSIILSDVLGDPLDIIASGPTVPNPTYPSDALEILRRFDASRSLPKSVYDSIEANSNDHGERGHGRSSTQDRLHKIIVLGNNATAVDAAGVRAESLGYSHAMTVAKRSEGAAESIGAHMADMAISMLRDRDLGKKTPDCLISGGEPTVTLAPASVRGRGGRNTHVVLAAMRRMIELNVDTTTRDRIVIVSGGTDGEDGPTDAAGAILTPDVWREAQRLSLDPADFLWRNDSYTFFQKTGGLIITGPTHTNVCDVRVVVVDSGVTSPA